jgi:hypothetical protein
LPSIDLYVDIATLPSSSATCEDVWHVVFKRRLSRSGLQDIGHHPISPLSISFGLELGSKLSSNRATVALGGQVASPNLIQT